MSETLADAFAWARFTPGAAEAPKVDEAAAAEAVAQAKAQMAAVTAAAEGAARADASARESIDAHHQAIFDAVHIIAAADGVVTEAEHAKIAAGLGSILGGVVDDATIQNGLAGAKAFFDEHGLEGSAAAIATAIPEADGRSALLVIASAVAWLDHGVGTKEGLALQALARAFGIAINDLHKLMAVGKVA